MENVTDTIKMLKERGFWVEIVTLVVPGFSDDADDLRRMADFLVSVDPLMPWHMTAFHPDYKMTEGYRRTTVDDLMKIVEYGKAAGLKYMYPGNLPGQVGEWENTRCHHCNATVIRRYGFLVQQSRVGVDGKCPDCDNQLPGVWGKSSGHGDGSRSANAVIRENLNYHSPALSSTRSLEPGPALNNLLTSHPPQTCLMSQRHLRCFRNDDKPPGANL